MIKKWRDTSAVETIRGTVLIWEHGLRFHLLVASLLIIALSNSTLSFVVTVVIYSDPLDFEQHEYFLTVNLAVFLFNHATLEGLFGSERVEQLREIEKTGGATNQFKGVASLL